MTPSPPCPPAELGLQVLQRNWLSSNQVVFAATADSPATVVDSGHARHSALTVALVATALGGQPLQRLLNTHLHSDHCGGNQALQAIWPAAQTLVPAASLAQVQSWQETHLSYQASGQHCPRFRADGSLQPGQRLYLGPAEWQVHAAPGHDPDAILLFEPQTRTLVAGDALWEARLAVIFPELEGQPGFAATRATLALIEQLNPAWVVPGHGPVFADVTSALAASRQRLSAFERDPARHARHAARALLLFHLMEEQRLTRPALEHWLRTTPLFVRMARQAPVPRHPAQAAGDWAHTLVDSLIEEALIATDAEWLMVRA